MTAYDDYFFYSLVISFAFLVGFRSVSNVLSLEIPLRHMCSLYTMKHSYEDLLRKKIFLDLRKGKAKLERHISSLWLQVTACAFHGFRNSF